MEIWTNIFKGLECSPHFSRNDAANNLILNDGKECTTRSDYQHTLHLVIDSHGKIQHSEVTEDLISDAEEIIAEDSREGRYDAAHARSFSQPSSIRQRGVMSIMACSYCGDFADTDDGEGQWDVPNFVHPRRTSIRFTSCGS